MRVGIIGCGNICGIYFQNLASFDETEVVACADLDQAKAEQAGATYGVRAHSSPEALLSDGDVDLVLNLTVPHAHYSVARAALEAGKHVYNEKPLAVEVHEGRELLALANSKGLLVGCAPDTFLGAGLQTCRNLIDQGAIGEPVAAQMFMLCHGHESWHPAPEFFYKHGGGPLMDMGPYYFTALVHLIGRIRRVGGMARASFAQRTITSQPLAGGRIAVETPTHIIGLLEFQQGALAEGCFSFDTWHSPLPPIVLHGTEGSMQVPDPNGFGGPIYLRGKVDKDWREVPIELPYGSNSRGLGVRDMAIHLKGGPPHRASGALAQHVLEAMHGVLTAAKDGCFVELGNG